MILLIDLVSVAELDLLRLYLSSSMTLSSSVCQGKKIEKNKFGSYPIHRVWLIFLSLVPIYWTQSIIIPFFCERWRPQIPDWLSYL